MRDLVDLASAAEPGIRTRTRILVAIGASLAVAVVAAAVLNQRAMDRTQTALWTVSGPPCQRTRPVALASLMAGQPATLNYDEARGAFVHGGVVCAEIDYDRGRKTRPFTVCQFGSPAVVRLDTPRGAVFFAPGGRPATISFAGGDPHCVLGVSFPAALFDS